MGKAYGRGDAGPSCAHEFAVADVILTRALFLAALWQEFRNGDINATRVYIVSWCGVGWMCSPRNQNTAPSGPPPVVRAPAAGQSWRYAKHDYFTRSIVDTQIDRVSKIVESVEIESRSETAEDKPITGILPWGESWWKEYMGTDAHIARAPTEMQSPWGMIVVDPHWSEMQAFEKAIPLWPGSCGPAGPDRWYELYDTGQP